MSWDRYAYVLNNPLKYRDPSGHNEDCGMGDSSCKVNYSQRDYDRRDRVNDGYNRNKSPHGSTKSSNQALEKETYEFPGSRIVTPVPLFTPVPYSTELPKGYEVEVSWPSFSIDWDKVDVEDAAIDGIALFADVAAIGLASVGMPGHAAGAELIGIAADGYGLANDVLDLVDGDPSGLFLKVMEDGVSALEVNFPLAFIKVAKVSPGFVLNLASLCMNMCDAVNLQWEK